MMSTPRETWRRAVGVKNDSCASRVDCYGFNCSTAGTEGHSNGLGIVPSRTLSVNSKTATTHEDLQKTFEKFGALHGVEVSKQGAFVRFADLRDAAVALEASDIGPDVKLHYASDASARELDEEGRVVVRVEGHLGICELCHIFSPYGAVRNIQDVPNVTIHKVIEFFDVRSAAKAIHALNAVEGDAMHAASVAYLERTRCKLFLIPPRLMEAMACMEGMPMKLKPPKTFPLGGATKTVPDLGFGEWSEASELLGSKRPTIAMTRFFDSSSSLLDPNEALSFNHLLPTTAQTCLGGFPDSNKTSTFADQSSNDSSNGLTLKEVLPSALGLYPDEDTENGPSVQPNSVNYGMPVGNNISGWNCGLGNEIREDALFAGFSPLDSSFMEQISGREDLPLSDQQPQDAVILSHLLEYQANVFRQVVDLEVKKRLHSLKSFDSPYLDSAEFPFRRHRNPEEWRSTYKTHNKKKASRFPRRSSAVDLEQEAERRAQQEKMYAMDLERVRTGKDKRTTLMIKNIPNKYTQHMLLARIEEEFKGTFDFFYLPIDFKNQCNVGYGFINMTSTDHIIPFVEHVHEQKWDKFNSDKVCCVTYARIQGRHALINHFQNSSLMLEETKHQPLLFKPNGDPEPFPMKPLA